MLKYNFLCVFKIVIPQKVLNRGTLRHITEIQIEYNGAYFYFVKNRVLSPLQKYSCSNPQTCEYFGLHRNNKFAGTIKNLEIQ